MLKKLLVVLFASAFALTAFAQAPKSEPKAPTGVEAKKTDKAVKGDKKAKAKAKAKSKAKADEKKAATK
jgi:hypothetical protein